MNITTKKSLIMDLMPACEGGKLDDISKVMDHHFYSLKTARSVFCVNDEKYLRDFLPQDAVVRDKGYLHSFINSRQIVTVMNRGEGETFKYTYTISLDTNFPSYLRSHALQKLPESLREAFVESLKLLAPHRSGIDITPYLYENADRINDPKVHETIKHYIDFSHAEEEKLNEDGEIVSTLNAAETSQLLEDIIRMVNDGRWKVLAKHAKIHMQLSYLLLLLGVNVRLKHPKKGNSFIMKELLEGISKSFGTFPEVELHMVSKYLDRTNQEVFFNRVQPTAKELLTKLANMAWDLSLHRTIHNDVSSMARVNTEHADFVVPYIFTFDSPLRTLLSKLKYNGWITYEKEGLKSVCVYPTSLYEDMQSFLKGNEEFFTEKKLRARVNLGKKFHTNPSLRKRLIKQAEVSLTHTLASMQK